MRWLAPVLKSVCSGESAGLLVAGLAVLAACGDAASSTHSSGLSYVTKVSDTSFGDGAGWGQAHLPEVIEGPPDGAEVSGAATGRGAVLSLGAGGEVTVEFDQPIVDGPGADFVVFENPFWVRDDPTEVWAELGEVSVSRDGADWQTFDCDTKPARPGQWPGCAGWTPTKEYDPARADSLDPDVSGGDAFDLADLDVESARFVRIRDMLGEANSAKDNAGFDLDAVGAIHLE